MTTYSVRTMPAHGPSKRRQVVCLASQHMRWLRQQSSARGISISDVVRRLIDKELPK